MISIRVLGASAGIGLAGSGNDSFDKINHVATAGLTVLGAGAGRKQVLL